MGFSNDVSAFGMDIHRVLVAIGGLCSPGFIRAYCDFNRGGAGLGACDVAG
jgi:hypothetical protein